ncbi:MAG: hypothetical protein AB1560_01870 [Pseudomonadota bacterium]
MKNSIEDLRNHLFETIERLKDDEKPMDIERAQAVANVAGKIIDSARVEVEHLKVMEQLGVRVVPDKDGKIGTGFVSNTRRLTVAK